MGVLDPRRRRLLDEMGIPVWRLRGRSDGPPEIQPEAESEAEAVADAVASAPPADQSGGVSAPAMDWAGLLQGIRGCDRCPLHATRQQAVPGVGDPDARVLIIGEAPGAEEDRRGEPFVGRAGKLLDAMLAAIGLDRQQGVYITNVVKSRPPQNRDPNADEIAACRPWLEAQIALIRPAVILAVGRVAAQSLTGRTARMGELRGRWHACGDPATPLLATYHPAYLLRTPSAKAKAWEDLLRLKRRLREAAG
ncbi:uracil-DNA glycosylase [Spiribacter onubensis]|uniref:Type-4 uracil-DNA glycosylase n=1 Tax=Spiribacter onubensis TaxID=3122420 RepID=A0ABV3S8Y5_9GAMM